MKRTVKRIIVLVLAFAFGVGVRLYGQVSTVMPKMSADSAAKVQAGADRYVMSCWEGIDYPDSTIWIWMPKQKSDPIE